MMMTSKNRRAVLAAACLTLAWSAGALAAVSAEEAKQLGKNLTLFGAEAGANADGSIPAYNPNYRQPVPADFKPGSGRYPDPYKDEKPLYTIDQKNMAQYEALLSVGAKALLERFPDYKINVYPTHRTMVYPDAVLKATVKAATTAKLVGTEDGDGIEGVFGGLPFPIPKTGLEVMWNQILRYQGPRTDMRFNTQFVDRTGRKTLVGDQETSFMWAWYDPKATALPDWAYMTNLTTFYGPPSQVGQLFLQKFSINATNKDDATWLYTPGQRRVRVAPEMKYDTPASAIGGVLTFDELGGFNGRRDRFDWKLVGKKEMIVPYNAFRAFFEPGTVGEKHENPDNVRWEKHRVWVVEATLKPGKRHIYSKRIYCIDEDTWLIMQYAAYDQSGQLYRVSNAVSFVPYDKPRVSQPGQLVYDLTKGNWAFTADLSNPSTHQIPYDETPPVSRFTPDSLSGSGVR